MWKYTYNSGNMNASVTIQSKYEKKIAQEGIWDDQGIKMENIL